MSIDTQFRLSDAEFNDALRMAVDSVQSYLTTEPLSTDYTPVLITHEIVAGDNGELTPRAGLYIMPDFDMSKRYKLLEAVGIKMGSEMQMLRCVFFISEAWVSRQPVDEPRKYAKPGDDPEREEVIVVSGMTVDGRCNGARVHVSRNERDEMMAGATETMPYGGEWEAKSALCAAFWQGYRRGCLDALVELDKRGAVSN